MKIAKCLGRAIDQTTYHGQIPLKGKEELLLIEVPVSLHVFWKEEGLLQSLNNMTCMPLVVMSNGGIPGNRDTIHLQFRRPYARWTAHLSRERIFSAFNRVGPPTSLVLGHPLLFVSLWKVYLALLKSLMLPLSPQFRIGFQPKISRELRKGRRRVHWGAWNYWPLGG